MGLNLQGAEYRSYQSMLAAQMNANGDILMGYGNPFTEKRSKPSWRTDEEIEEQLKARMAELRKEAESPERLRPCETCRWSRQYSYIRCHNPLIKGFGDAPFVDLDGSFELNAKLCGKERVLWEPRQTIWMTWIDWLLGIFDKLFGKKDQ